LGLQLGLVACGLLIIPLSFLPWVEFEGEDLVDGGTFSFGVAGTELSRLRGPDYYQPADIADQETDVCTCRTDLGDGYFTAILGAIVVLAAAVSFFLGQQGRRAAWAVAIAAGLGAFGIAGYNAAGEWQAIGAANQDDPFVEMSGTVLPALYILTLAAAAAAVLGGLLWRGQLQDEAEDRLVEDDFESEADYNTENYLVWA
jgi:hypothetical protein